VRLAVDSLLAQTWGDFELIVVDDASNDRTAEILRAYASQDARVVIVTNPENLGLTRSLNVGVARARGEYVARQDADDISAPERLAQQVAFLDRHPEVGVLGTLSQVIDPAGNVVPNTFRGTLATNADLQAGLLQDNVFCHGSVIMRRDLLVAAGGYDEAIKVTEDYDLWLRLAEVTQLANLETALYFYRIHPESIGRKHGAHQLTEKAKALERALRRRYGEPPDERLAVVAQHHLSAAQAAYAHGDFALARAAAAAALRLSPTLFGSAELAQALNEVYHSGQPLAAGIQFTQALFDDLPPTPDLDRLQARLQARLYMREVFNGHQQRDGRRVRRNWWPGVQRDPRWLLNRGVVSIVIQSYLKPAR
jgi:glycosyltransferase involved in cell wall biosynthesis